MFIFVFFFFSSRRRHTRWNCDWSSDVCSSDLVETVLDAQMSVAYALAWIIVRAKLTLDEFTPEALRDPTARALMARIELVVDPAAHGERQTVEVETTDGRLLSSRVEIPRGHWEAPLSGAEVRDKFLGL